MKVYLGLGTNLGDKEANLHTAVQQINMRIGKVTSLSAFYVTAPWGFSSEHSFLNAPFEVLEKTQSIERDLGRTKKSVDGNYSDRLIDIDLLLYGDLILDTPALTLPHPLMHERRFVMEPLAEIAPKVVHPVLKQTMEYLKQQQ